MVLAFFEGLIIGLEGLEACLGDLGAGLGDSVWRFEGCWVVNILGKGQSRPLKQVGVRVDKSVRMMLVGENLYGSWLKS